MRNEDDIVMRTIASPIAFVLLSGARNTPSFLFKMGGLASCSPSPIISVYSLRLSLSPPSTAVRVSFPLKLYPKGRKEIANSN